MTRSKLRAWWDLWYPAVVASVGVAVICVALHVALSRHIESIAQRPTPYVSHPILLRNIARDLERYAVDLNALADAVEKMEKER